MRYLRGGLVVVAAMALLAPAAGAVVTKTPGGARIGLMLRAGSLASRPSSGSTTGGVLVSHGGPVLGSEAPYVIYWAPGGTSGSSYSIPSASESLLTQYLTDVAAASTASSTTNVYSVLTQYNTPYSQIFSTAQTNTHPYTQSVIDMDPFPAQSGCSLAPGMTACVSDASLQAEIENLIQRGKLPSATWSSSGATPIFFMITPIDVNVCTSGGSCVNNSFCAYHSEFSYSGSNVLYASVPFSVFANGSTKGCQTDQYSTIYESPTGTYHGDEAYNIADDLSHELSETITDPLINAWYSKNGLEVGDLCEAYGARVNTSKGLSPLAYAPAFDSGTGNASAGYLYDQLINGDQYYNQTEFSNSANKCLPGVTQLPGTPVY